MSDEPDPLAPSHPAAHANGALPRSLDELHGAVAAMLDEPVADISIDDDLVLDWGLDSMRVMDFVERLRARGADVAILDLAEQPTIRAWDALLTDRASWWRGP
jgi:aryl carrier-like protein